MIDGSNGTLLFINSYANFVHLLVSMIGMHTLNCRIEVTASSCEERGLYAMPRATHNTFREMGAYFITALALESSGKRLRAPGLVSKNLMDGNIPEGIALPRRLVPKTQMQSQDRQSHVLISHIPLLLAIRPSKIYSFPRKSKRTTPYPSNIKPPSTALPALLLGPRATVFLVSFVMASFHTSASLTGIIS
ncbi:hypothetical protein FA13DRAFT_1706119 [Coprinellus micaceus]|uniref:Uncharacterized protein n=1 Tax=Coprinellus micaceus TaxID=71717 RepID=A0A4Y7TTQ2_COPMI|nr:hypothetical protein FA13DRAFT_1706119 [Coprinellus micaceus]